MITGAASGIGRATARVFSDEGARVVVADIGAGRVGAVVGRSTMPAAGRSAAVRRHQSPSCMPSSMPPWTASAGSTSSSTTGIGPRRRHDREAEFEDVWRRTLRSTPTPRSASCVTPSRTSAAGNGRIVNIASTEGIIATGGITPYTASKHAVIGLTKSFAVELGRTGITVNCVCPGPVRTAITADIPDADKEIYAKRRVPLRRYAEPEEIAQMIVSIALPASSFMNGSVVVVDGGLTIRH